MAGSVGPKVGPNWLVVGDAAGSINPFNGEGIDYAYETGRLASTLVAEALATNDGLVIHRYPEILDEEFQLYFKVARLFAKVIGQPQISGNGAQTQASGRKCHSTRAAEVPWPRGPVAFLLKVDGPSRKSAITDLPWSSLRYRNCR